MWNDMFVEQIPLAEKVIRTIGVYALLMVLFRLTGKRGLAAMNTFDFVVIFLLSNVVQNGVPPKKWTRLTCFRGGFQRLLVVDW